MSWEEVYALWKEGLRYFPKMLSDPVTVEKVFVRCEREGHYIYGYDWLDNAAAESRKRLIDENPSEFLFFTEPTARGTIRTAEMLAEARSEEELAAVWIAATARELSDYRLERGAGCCAEQLRYAALDFLQERFRLWHHAMRHLVPEIVIPSPVLASVVCNDAVPVMGLIQMNTMMLKNGWSILRYSSLEEEQIPDSCRRKVRIC